MLVESSNHITDKYETWYTGNFKVIETVVSEVTTCSVVVMLCVVLQLLRGVYIH